MVRVQTLRPGRVLEDTRSPKAPRSQPTRLWAGQSNIFGGQRSPTVLTPCPLLARATPQRGWSLACGFGDTAMHVQERETYARPGSDRAGSERDRPMIPWECRCLVYIALSRSLARPAVSHAVEWGVRFVAFAGLSQDWVETDPVPATETTKPNEKYKSKTLTTFRVKGSPRRSPDDDNSQTMATP
jgi:hypothetical protein